MYVYVSHFYRKVDILLPETMKKADTIKIIIRDTSNYLHLAFMNSLINWLSILVLDDN